MKNTGICIFKISQHNARNGITLQECCWITITFRISFWWYVHHMLPCYSRPSHNFFMYDTSFVKIDVIFTEFNGHCHDDEGVKSHLTRLIHLPQPTSLIIDSPSHKLHWETKVMHNQIYQWFKNSWHFFLIKCYAVFPERFSLPLMCMHRPHYTLRINIGYTLYTVELLKSDHPICMKDNVNHSAILLIKKQQDCFNMTTRITMKCFITRITMKCFILWQSIHNVMCGTISVCDFSARSIPIIWSLWACKTCGILTEMC